MIRTTSIRTATLIWSGLFFGASALALSFYLDHSLRSGALTYEQQIDLLWLFHLLGKPGMLLSSLLGERASFWLTDHPDHGYFNEVYFFFMLNCSGWILAIWIGAKFMDFTRFRLSKARNADTESASDTT